MSKQDRQGVRTIADLERKHSRVLSGNDDQNAAQSRQIEQLQQSIASNTGSFYLSLMALSDRVTALEQAGPGSAGGDAEKITALETAVSGLAERLTAAEATIALLEARVAALEV